MRLSKPSDSGLHVPIRPSRRKGSLFIFLNLFLFCIFCPSHQSLAEDKSTVSFDSDAIVAVKVEGLKDFCSGVVVSKNKILTATHCVYNLKDKKYYSPAAIKIGIGENIYDDGFKWLSVEKIASHPNTDIKTVRDFLGNDIITLSTVNPLPVTPLKISPEVGHNSTLSAWGFGEDEWGYYGIRKARTLEGKIIENKLITFSSGACRGDSGGPILNNKAEVVGIVSMSDVRHCTSSGKRIAQRVNGKF